MGLFDFLKKDVLEKRIVPKYTANLSIDGREMAVANLGVASVTVAKGRGLKRGQKVAFSLALQDPKETLRLTGAGTVSSSDKSGTKIDFMGLPEDKRMQVARFLARYVINR